MYPQYAASTTATVVDERARWLLQTRNQPEMRFIRNFHDHDGLSAPKTFCRHWQANGSLGEKDRLLISFHGLPKRSLDLGDPISANATRPAACWPNAWELNPSNIRSASSPASARLNGCSPTLPRRWSNGRAWRSPGRCDLPRLLPPTARKPGRNRPEGAMISCRPAARNITTSRHSTRTMPGSRLADIAERHLAGWPTQTIDPHRLWKPVPAKPSNSAPGLEIRGSAHTSENLIRLSPTMSESLHNVVCPHCAVNRVPSKLGDAPNAASASSRCSSANRWN